MWDYHYTSLANASVFSATDVMPLTLHAKLLTGIESVFSLHSWCSSPPARSMCSAH